MSYTACMSNSPTVSPPHAAVVPVPRLENDFYDWDARHAAKCRAAAAGNHDLVFIGDSITHLFEGDPAWPGRGEQVWAEFYGHHKVLNLGYGWDRTQNVLWRLAHGEFANQAPRLVVLLIGTNNLAGTPNCIASTPEQTVEGIQMVCTTIAAAAPVAHILLMAVLPRGTPQEQARPDIRRINQQLEAFARAATQMTYLDIGPRFLDPSGNIPLALMDDLCHPTAAGYRIWAQAIEPIVRRHVCSGCNV